MKKGFVYKIESRQAPNHLNRSGAALLFIVPKEKMSFAPVDLIDNPLWIIVEDGKSAYLTERGLIESVSVINKGVRVGDYIVELSPTRTIKTTNASTDKKKWELENDQKIDSGFNSCSEGDALKFEDMIRKNVVIRIAGVDLKSPEDLKRWKSKNGFRLASIELAKLIGTTSLEDLEANTKFKEMSPFGYQVYRSFKTIGTEEDVQLRNVVGKIDPLNFLVGEEDKVVVSDHVSISFDVELKAITPEEIYARTFVAGSKTMSFDETLKKTEQAEQLHQEIVRGIVQGLINLGRQPLASRSIDVGFKNLGTTYVLEVKTVVEDNFTSQFHKGVSQLLFYLAELDLFDSRPTKGILILGNPSNVNFDDLYLKMASKANVDVVVYNSIVLESLPNDLLLQNYLNE